jgi:hypothetical protein
MKDENLQRAKEIFFQYSCNHSHLDWGDDVDEYKSFGITREQESKWILEYISYWISQLSVEDLKAVQELSQIRAEESLTELFRVSLMGDSFAKLTFANAIWHIANGQKTSRTMRELARQKAIFLWQSLLNSPIELTDEHRKEISGNLESQARVRKNIKPDNTQQASTPEEYILTSAKFGLTKAKSDE